MRDFNENTNWHALGVEDVLSTLEVGREGGLTAGEAEARLGEYGPNRLPEPEKEGFLKKFFKHFHDVLIYILIFGAVVTAVMQHYVDTVVIMLVVIINAIIGYVQENKAENALGEIRKILALKAHVLRDGKREDVEADNLVPGDIVYLSPGDRVPADLRLVSTASLRLEESALTGEAEPSEKQTGAIEEDSPLGDRSNLAFSGTSVSAGTGVGVVVATGGLTEVGKINRLMGEVHQLTTPLLRQIARFSKVVAVIILGLCGLVFVAGLLLRPDYTPGDLLVSVIALAIAAIPEGLPAIISIILALGVQSMARRNAIVRNLPSVETLGSVSVICSDKTGTLTKNEMTASALVTPDGRYEVSGTGYSPDGKISRGGSRVELASETHGDAPLRELLTCFRACNEAEVAQDEEGRWQVKGEPTEGALAALWLKSHLKKDWSAPLQTLPFDSDYKYMAVLIEGESENVIYVKGAPERLSELSGGENAPDGSNDVDGASGQDSQDGQNGRDGKTGSGKNIDWSAEVTALAKEGLRTIAAARKTVPASQRELSHEDLQGGLVMLGLAGIIDPPREEAVEAVRECAEAGIQVKMITGDHLETARAIGKRMGIGDGNLAMDGRQIDSLDDESLRMRMNDCHIFARTSPEHKLRLVRALQADGKICAMTGDGVNDAPALKMADIGIAMGIKGTEVTKEAAEIVLADDNFQTIAAAVEEGRKVYDNLRKTLLFILPTNLAEGLLIVVSILFGSIAVLTPVQVLWVNMVTTVTISFALAFEPLEPCAMRRRPRPPQEPLLGKYFLFRIVYVGLVMGGACLVLSFKVLDLSVLSESAYQTIMVQTLVLCECLYLFNVRHITEPAFNQQFFQNRVTFAVLGILVLLQAFATYVPFMNRALGTAPLEAGQWIPPLLVALILFCVVEIEKSITRAVLRKRAGSDGVPCAEHLS